MEPISIAVVSSLGTGLVTLLFFFIKNSFTKIDKTDDIVTTIRMEMAGFSVRLDGIDKRLERLISKADFISEKQLPQIFKYIDAPKRSTDIKGVK